MSGHKISKTKGISYSRIKEIKGYISEITAMPENFGLHSGALDRASAAANNGILDRLISMTAHASSIAEYGCVAISNNFTLGSNITQDTVHKLSLETFV